MENQENEFVTKKIEQPILGSQIKDQIKSETKIIPQLKTAFTRLINIIFGQLPPDWL